MVGIKCGYWSCEIFDFICVTYVGDLWLRFVYLVCSRSFEAKFTMGNLLVLPPFFNSHI
jgi:hypothetical protein